MISNPSRLALSGMALVCAAILVACSSAPRLQFLAVAPIGGEIYVRSGPVAVGPGAARHAVLPALQPRGTTGRTSAASLSAVTATCRSLQYAATALFSDGSTKDVSNTATWSSSNTSVAQISTSGLATGIGPGTTNIGATFSGISAASETLAVDLLNSITLSPSNPSVPLGTSQPFSAIGNFTFAAGGSGNLDVSSQVTWGSSNTTVATIDSSGNATTVGTGSTNITATSCDGTIGTTMLTVTPVAATSLVVTPSPITISTGTTTLFTAMEKLSNGTIQALPPGTVVTWSSDAASVATVDPNSGVALGVTAGTANITASSSGLNPGSAALTVQAAAARFAYVANLQGNGSGTGLGGGTISAYSVNVTAGTLTPLTGSPIAANTPQQVLIHPSGDLLYFINASSQIETEFVDSVAGGLTYAHRTPSVAGNKGTNVGVIDPLGRFIYVIDDGINNSPTFAPSIYGYTIKQTNTQTTNGVLTLITAVNNYSDATLKVSSWAMTDRAGKYLYVVNNASSTVSQYSINQSTGALTPLSPPTIPTGLNPNYATTDVKGHIYVANSGDGTVSVFTIASNTGLLTQVGSSNFHVTGAGTVFNVLTDPTGKYLYVLDSPGATAGQVFTFGLDQTTGAITSAIGTPPATGKASIGMAIDPTGAFLAVDNNADYTISLYKVNTSTGAPTAASPATVPADSVPQFVTFYTAASGQ